MVYGVWGLWYGGAWVFWGSEFPWYGEIWDFGGLSYHDMESEAPFTLQKIFGTGSDKNGTRTQKNGSARVNFEV